MELDKSYNWANEDLFAMRTGCRIKREKSKTRDLCARVESVRYDSPGYSDATRHCLIRHRIGWPARGEERREEGHGRRERKGLDGVEAK